MRNKEKGITLIAIVITIIILLILAGVTLSLTIGSNGIITKAKEAERQHKIAEIKEQIGLEIISAQIEATARTEQLEKAQIEDIIKKYGKLQEDGDTIILNEIEAEVSLLDIYKGTNVKSGSYTANKAQLKLLQEQVEALRLQIDGLENSELQSELLQTTATADKILKDYKAYSNGRLLTGTLEIPSLASQTPGNADASDLVNGKTAWVNGILITGNNQNEYTQAQYNSYGTTKYDEGYNAGLGYYYKTGTLPTVSTTTWVPIVLGFRPSYITMRFVNSINEECIMIADPKDNKFYVIINGTLHELTSNYEALSDGFKFTMAVTSSGASYEVFARP